MTKHKLPKLGSILKPKKIVAGYYPEIDPDRTPLMVWFNTDDILTLLKTEISMHPTEVVNMQDICWCLKTVLSCLHKQTVCFVEFYEYDASQTIKFDYKKYFKLVC